MRMGSCSERSSCGTCAATSWQVLSSTACFPFGWTTQGSWLCLQIKGVMDPAWLGEANDAVDAMEPSAPPPGAGQTIESWNEQFPEDAEAVSRAFLLQSICVLPTIPSIRFQQ